MTRAAAWLRASGARLGPPGPRRLRSGEGHVAAAERLAAAADIVRPGADTSGGGGICFLARVGRGEIRKRRGV